MNNENNQISSMVRGGTAGFYYSLLTVSIFQCTLTEDAHV